MATHIKESENDFHAIADSWQENRPWNEFFDIEDFNFVKTFDDLPIRVTNNFCYFLSNYLLIFISCLCVWLLHYPIMLLVVILQAVAAYVVRQRKKCGHTLHLFGREISETLQYLILILIFVPSLIYLGIGDIILWSILPS